MNLFTTVDNLTILGLREIHNLIYNKKLCNQL